MPPSLSDRPLLLGEAAHGRSRSGILLGGCDAEFLHDLEDLPLPLGEEVRPVGLQVAQQGHQLADMGLFLVPDVHQDLAHQRIVGRLGVGVVEKHGLELPGDVDAQGLDQLLLVDLSVDVAWKRVGKIGHGKSLLPVPSVFYWIAGLSVSEFSRSIGQPHS